MALTRIKRISSLAYFPLALMLLALAYLLSAVTSDSSSLNDLFFPIFGLAIGCLILLSAILVRSFIRLRRDFKQRKAGSRFTVRLVSLFVLLLLVSTTIVYSFSIHFLHRGINSWFDVEIEQALNDSLELSRSSLGIRMRTLLRQTRLMAGVLSELPETDINHSLRELNQLSGAIEMGIWAMDGRLVTSSIENPAIIVPNRPDEAIFRQLSQQQDYIGIDPGPDDKLQLRAAVSIPTKQVLSEDRMLHVIFPVNEELSTLSKTVQNAYTNYKELSYLRQPLITIFTLSLSLIVLLTVLVSIYFALWISKRIVHPLQQLADGTQSVASGNYDMQLSSANHDEIGFLVRSFNQMTQRLNYERNTSQRSHQMLEQQSNYLGAVLSSLSSGVITFDEGLRLKTANVASKAILDVDLDSLLETPLNQLSHRHSHLHNFVAILVKQTAKTNSWQQQLDLHPKKYQQTLMCRGKLLPNNAGWVIVFDDITTLLQAQRNAAWGEVARRLAHEIKNPLTPIQLSAERLQRKYTPLLKDNQTELLNKLTNTIINQVDAMKDMVNDFSNYARSPSLQLSKQNITQLISDVLDLYQSVPSQSIKLLKTTSPLILNVDVNRFRQVIHNLIKNAIEASNDAELPVKIEVACIPVKHNHTKWLEISVNDAGPGIPDTMLHTLFEPYATNKTKGTGLGLAIVKKIIEEHDGIVWAENRQPNGACIIIRLPLEETEL